jgi:preprotein translocase subunit SecE
MTDTKNPSATSNSRTDTLRWVVAFALTAVAIGANGYYSDVAFLYRLVGVVVLVGIALAVIATTAKGKEFQGLFKEARAEVRRITWPSKQETLTTSGVVVVAVLISALVLWAIDAALGALVSLVVG